MEQSESFKKVQETVEVLEKRLALCTSINQVCEQSAVEAEAVIEEYFAKCINILACRKSELLREVAHNVATQKKSVDDTRTKLEASIEVCKMTMKTASLMYALNASAAETICKEVKNVPIPKVFDAKISTELPASLLGTIKTLGKVNISSHFSVAETASTIAGSIAGNVDGNGLNARFSYPWGICANPYDGCLYICDSCNQSIRKLTIQGEVSTFVAVPGLGIPSLIVMNYNEKMFYVTNRGNHTILKVTAAGVVSVLAGNGQSGKADGMGVNASFCNPYGIAIDQQTGTLYVCDFDSHLIRKISPQGQVTTIAGSERGYADGNGKNAKFALPWGICFDEYSQSLIIADYGNHKIRRILSNGEVSTLCEIKQPTGVAIADKRTILVSSYAQVYTLTQTGPSYEVTVLAGTGKQERVDGKAEECGFNKPFGIAVHEPSHSCFIAEYGSHSIRKLSFPI